MSDSPNKRDQLLQRFDFAKKQNLDLKEELEQYATDHDAFNAPFMEGSTFTAVLSTLKDERDLRGFDAVKGWIHATAHTADLLAALVRHPSFAQQDQAAVLRAIWRRLATADVVFAFSEQDRLANAIAAMAERQDFVEAGFESWLHEMDETDQSVWRENPPKMAGLERFENDTYFLNAFVARLSQSEISAAAEEAKKAALKSLRRRGS